MPRLVRLEVLLRQLPDAALEVEGAGEAIVAALHRVGEVYCVARPLRLQIARILTLKDVCGL